MGNCICLCPCLEGVWSAHRRTGYQHIDEKSREGEERRRQHELAAMKIPPPLPQQFSKLYRLGDLLGSGTTSRVFRVYRHKQQCQPQRTRLSSSDSITMMALEKKSNSRYNLMVDESTQRFLIDSSDEENEGESELNYSTERDNDLNKIGSRGGCDAFHRTAHDHNIEDYEPVVEKSLFVSSSSSIALACKIIDKKSLALGIEDNDFVLFQLRKEIDILRRIQHPHIVRYYDYTETKNHILIITECLSGGELFDYLAKNGALSEDQAKHAFYGVFSAVAYLHDRGVIHRDIKAENVILSHTPNKISGIDGSGGSDLTMKLIDFGFSTITRHSLTESFLGTAGYIAPEIRQHKSYSTSVDDWALGVLVYCALSGRLPFGTSIELLPPTIQQCEDLFKVRFPAQLWSKISSECKDFISSLLRVDPLLRMTAKHALSHPWFADAAKKHNFVDNRLIGSFSINHEISLKSKEGLRIELQRKFMHRGMHSCSSGQFLELPELHSILRPIRSTIALEKKSKRTKKKMLDTSKSSSTPQCYGGQQEKDPALDDCAHTDSTASLFSLSSNAILSRVASVCIEQSGHELHKQRVHSENKNVGVTTSPTTTTASSSCNNLAEAGHSTDSSTRRERHLSSHSLQNKLSVSIIKQKQKPNISNHHLIWDELHHKNAGSLFFSTYMPSYGAINN